MAILAKSYTWGKFEERKAYERKVFLMCLTSQLCRTVFINHRWAFKVPGSYQDDDSSWLLDHSLDINLRETIKGKDQDARYGRNCGASLD